MNMKEFANWVQHVREGTAPAVIFCDWLEDNNYSKTQQWREAAKYIQVADRVYQNKALQIFKGKKQCGMAAYYCKHKVVTIHQFGYQVALRIRNRMNFETNDYVNRICGK